MQNQVHDYKLNQICEIQADKQLKIVLQVEQSSCKIKQINDNTMTQPLVQITSNQTTKVTSQIQVPVNQNEFLVQQQQQEPFKGNRTARSYFDRILNWPRSERQKNSQITYRLGYVILIEIARLLLVKEGVTLNRICDKFSVKKKSHEEMKALFGYTINSFPFSQNSRAQMSHLRVYVERECYYNDQPNSVTKNLIKQPGKVMFDRFLEEKILLWRNARKTQLLLDHIKLREGLTLRCYLSANQCELVQVIKTIDDLSYYL